MNAKVEQAAAKLVIAKGEYRRLLRGVDGLLRAAVAQDPANIDDANEVRRSYLDHGLELEPFVALVQPEGKPDGQEVAQIVDEPVEPVETKWKTPRTWTGAEVVTEPEAVEVFAKDIGRSEEPA